ADRRLGHGGGPGGSPVRDVGAGRPGPADRPGHVGLRRGAVGGVAGRTRRVATRCRAGEPAMRLATRVRDLPPYLFAELDKRVAAKRAQGADVISLGVGDPDMPTPPHVVEALQRAVEDASTHRYPSYYGMPELRGAIAAWYRTRFGVDLDPDTEVLPLIGSKEGIAHLAVAFVDPGDQALVSDPGYPVYGIGTALAGGEPVSMPLSAAGRFLPDFATVPV